MTIREPGPADLKGIRELFIKMLGEELQLIHTTGEKFDIRDRIAVLTLADRVLAREKQDDNAAVAGSKVREYAPTFKAPARVGAGGTHAGSDDDRAGEGGNADGDTWGGSGPESDEGDDSEDRAA